MEQPDFTIGRQRTAPKETDERADDLIRPDGFQGERQPATVRGEFALL
jgi:hypothetical protein